ncbi:hypothetical protein [Pseudomonas fragi]|uniref:hypothetical protein n=1 Tax=Pseudomonas fragi TaxID=296 RepID=UPI000BA23D73|nr:hypothetical protein [Pseudomonas fragi]PAA13594.1 hypothetical protein CJU74_17450 [Pseudomonas fragi]
MNTKSKIIIEPGCKYRREAGPYDPKTHLPRYGFEVVTADADAKRRVVDESQVMGHSGSHFWVWDIRNNSTQLAFITLTKDGAPL